MYIHMATSSTISDCESAIVFNNLSHFFHRLHPFLIFLGRHRQRLHDGVLGNSCFTHSRLIKNKF